MSRKVPNQSFEVFIFAIRRGKKYSKTKINHKTGEGGRKRLQILRWMQRKMNCTSWVRHSGTRGLFPGARLLISKSTGLDDLCWSKGVHEMPAAKCLNCSILAGCPRVALCAPRCLVLSSLWITYKKKGHSGFTWVLLECKYPRTNCCGIKTTVSFISYTGFKGKLGNVSHTLTITRITTQRLSASTNETQDECHQLDQNRCEIWSPWPLLLWSHGVE